MLAAAPLAGLLILAGSNNPLKLGSTVLTSVLKDGHAVPPSVNISEAAGTFKLWEGAAAGA